MNNIKGAIKHTSPIKVHILLLIGTDDFFSTFAPTPRNVELETSHKNIHICFQYDLINIFIIIFIITKILAGYFINFLTFAFTASANRAFFGFGTAHLTTAFRFALFGFLRFL